MTQYHHQYFRMVPIKIIKNSKIDLTSFAIPVRAAATNSPVSETNL